MFAHITKDRVSLIKPNGEEIDDIRALVNSKTILIEDENLPIEEGDTILRKLPNGLFEKYQVLDRGFISGMGGISSHYQVKVRKEGSLTEGQKSSYVINLQGNNARVNIHSQDSSTNIISETSETVFADLRQAIQTIQNEDEKQAILKKLDELQSANGTPRFIELYRDFMSVASDHIGVISPFIPALSQLLG